MSKKRSFFSTRMHDNTLYELLKKAEEKNSSKKVLGRLVERYYYEFQSLYDTKYQEENKLSQILDANSKTSLEHKLDHLIKEKKEKHKLIFFGHNREIYKMYRHSNRSHDMKDLIDAKGLDYDNRFFSEDGFCMLMDIGIKGYLPIMFGKLMFSESFRNSGFTHIITNPLMWSFGIGAVAFGAATVAKNIYRFCKRNEQPDYEKMKEQARYIDLKLDEIRNNN